MNIWKLKKNDQYDNDFTYLERNIPKLQRKEGALYSSEILCDSEIRSPPYNVTYVTVCTKNKNATYRGKSIRVDGRTTIIILLISRT